ncbi:MAG: hypothetical protein AB1801_17490 [Chloroflexota bacterium]
MINFAEVQHSVQELKNQLGTNQIDEKTFEDRLLDLIDMAEDGHYWMYGHQSERWFRHNGHKWVPDDPQRVLAMRSGPDAATSAGAVEPNEEAMNISWGWFMASLVIIFLIGAVVYSSTLS